MSTPLSKDNNQRNSHSYLARPQLAKLNEQALKFINLQKNRSQKPSPRSHVNSLSSIDVTGGKNKISVLMPRSIGTVNITDETPQHETDEVGQERTPVKGSDFKARYLNTNDLLNQLQQLKFEVDSLQSIAKSLKIKLAKSEIRNKLLTSKVEKLKAKCKNARKLSELNV